MPVNGKSRRSYRGAPVSNTLGVTLSAAATNITLAIAVSGWSTDAEPFFVVVDPGTAKEEKICVKYSSSTTLTVVDPSATSTWSASANGRGADNTTDRQHEQGAVIYPVFTATEANQANELVSKYANAGSVVYQGSGTPGTFTELAVGTAAHVLKVNAGATAPEWGQVATAGIADSAITSAKIADGTIVLADLATALQRFLVPVGTIAMYGGVAAPTGWLLCDGTSTTGYTALADIVGATTPDMRGRFPIGDNATLTLRGTGGSLTISTSNMPSHTHTQDAHNHTQNAHNHTQDAHNHTQDAHAHGHPHTHGYNATLTDASGVHNNADAGNAYFAAGTNGAGSNVLSGYSANPNDTNNATATNQATTATNQAATATNQATTATNQATGGGTDYYPPYLVVNYIIKHD